jgi:hypothetical protein
MLQCNDTVKTNSTLVYLEDLNPYGNTSRQDMIRLRDGYSTYQVYRQIGGLVVEDMSNIPSFLSMAPCPQTITESYQEDKTGSKSRPRFQIANGSMLLGSMAVRRCFAAVAKYNVDISFINGVQNISYSTSETQPLEARSWELENMTLRTVNSMQEHISLLSLIESLVANFDVDGRSLDSMSFDLADLQSPKWTNMTYDNGTVYRRYLGCTARPVTSIRLRGNWTHPTAAATEANHLTNYLQALLYSPSPPSTECDRARPNSAICNRTSSL